MLCCLGSSMVAILQHWGKERRFCVCGFALLLLPGQPCVSTAFSEARHLQHVDNTTYLAVFSRGLSKVT